MGPKSCSRPSTCQPCMLPSKLSFPSTLLDVPLVLSWTLVMVYPTPSPSMKVMLSPTPSSVWTWLAVSSPTTSRRSSPREATLSPPLPSVKLSVTSRRNSAMLPLTSNKKWQLPLPPPPWRNPMNCPMAKLSPLATNVSVPQKPSSSHLSWEWNPAVSMRPPTTPSCPEAPPCTQVLLTECKRKSLPWPHRPLRSRSLLHLRENTPYGSEDPSWLLFPPSNRCGSPSKNTTSADHPLSTENASKYFRPVAQLKHYFLFKKSGVNFNLQHSKIENFKILFFFVKCKFKISFGIKLPIWL